MKPQLLGRINPKLEVADYNTAFFQRRLEQRRKWLGEVDPIAAALSDRYLAKLLEFAHSHGLKYKKQTYYTGTCYLPLHGSVGWHTDEGIGHLLCWVLYREDFGESVTSTERPCLLCQSAGKVVQIQRLDVGDVFIFNGNYGHAWISNESCVLAQITVSVNRRHASDSVLPSSSPAIESND